MVLERTRIATAPRVARPATAYRNQAPRYDPRSGVVAELTRQGTRHVVGIEGLLPRVLYRYELDLHRVWNLTDGQTRDHVGITIRELVGNDWSTCQQIGAEAYASGDQAIRTFSATGVDTVLVLFPEPIGSGLVEVELIERWENIADLTQGRAAHRSRAGLRPLAARQLPEVATARAASQVLIEPDSLRVEGCAPPVTSRFPIALPGSGSSIAPPRAAEFAGNG